MKSFNQKKISLLNTLFFEAGAALMDCQTLEYSVTFFLFQLSRIEPKKIDTNKIILILDNKDKKTLGQLIKIVKAKLELGTDFEEILNSALSARNHIIHRILIDNCELFIQKETRDNLVKKIRSLRRLVQKGISILDPYIEKWNKELDGLDFKSFEIWMMSNFH